MAQSFVTTYKNHYRWHEYGARHAIKPKERFDDFKTDDDLWFRPDDSDKEIRENPIEMIKKMYKNRMWSVYQVEYCKSLKDGTKAHAGAAEGPSFENELLEYCRHLYEGEKQSKIAAPLPTARKIFGYIRPSRLYTPLTNYQFYFGKTGYELMTKKPNGKPQINPSAIITQSPENKSPENSNNNNRTIVLCGCTLK